MLFSHDVEHALISAVDLVNSAPRQDSPDELPDVAALVEFVEAHAISDVGRLTNRDLEAVRRVRAAMAPVFDAPDDASAADLVNRLIAQAPATPHLTDHDGYPLHMHYFSPGAALADHLALDVGMALAQVIAAGERERLRRCDAPGCDQVLVDLSRNRSRRYCDARTCGNRLHVAAYRQRQRLAN